MSVVVIAYHDIAANGDYTSWLKIPLHMLSRHLKMLKRFGDFINPEEITESLCRKKERNLKFLLTFDDGFSNTCDYGLPILQELDIPALFFLSTKHLESREPFWFDRIISAIQISNSDVVDLRAIGLGRYRVSSVSPSRRWHDIQILLEDIKRADASQNGSLVDAIVLYLRQFCQEDKLSMAENMCRPLSAAQVIRMHRSGVCRFGSHGDRHVILPKLDDESLREELIASRRILESLLAGETINQLSYPNGNHDERVRKACYTAGFRFGYTTTAGRMDSGTDPLSIPRVMIGGFDTPSGVAWKVFNAFLRKNPT